jgi:hypothetical protein
LLFPQFIYIKRGQKPPKTSVFVDISLMDPSILARFFGDFPRFCSVKRGFSVELPQWVAVAGWQWRWFWAILGRFGSVFGGFGWFFGGFGWFFGVFGGGFG